jgi:hypothetical protein
VPLAQVQALQKFGMFLLTDKISVMKYLLALFLIFMFGNSQAQVSFPYNYKFFYGKGSKSIEYMLKKEGVKLSIDSASYKKIENTGENFLVIKNSKNSNIRAFKILKEHNNFFLLCSEIVDMCKCKSSTFIYYIPDSKLQRIEKPFSFSLKRNLISRLKEMKIDYPKEYDSLTFCEIMNSL